MRTCKNERLGRVTIPEREREVELRREATPCIADDQRCASGTLTLLGEQVEDVRERMGVALGQVLILVWGAGRVHLETVSREPISPNLPLHKLIAWGEGYLKGYGRGVSDTQQAIHEEGTN